MFKALKRVLGVAGGGRPSSSSGPMGMSIPRIENKEELKKADALQPQDTQPQRLVQQEQQVQQDRPKTNAIVNAIAPRRSSRFAKLTSRLGRRF